MAAAARIVPPVVYLGWQYGIGVDPSLSGTGLVLARFRRTTAGPGKLWPSPIDFEVLAVRQIAAPAPSRIRKKERVARPMPDRLYEFHDRIKDAVFGLCAGFRAHDEPGTPQSVMHVALEDPSDYRGNKKARGRAAVRTATVLGAAFGVVAHAVMQGVFISNLAPHTTAYGTEEWMPRTRTGGFTHHVGHDTVVRLIRGQGYAFLADHSEDITMAAGVLCHHWRRLGFHNVQGEVS